MKKYAMLILLFIIILSSCYKDNGTTPDNTFMPGKSPILQPTLKMLPSPTVLLPASTSSSTLKPTSPLNTSMATVDPIESLAGYQRQCLPVTESSISEVSFPGQILIYRPDYYQYIDLTGHQAKNLVAGNTYIGHVDDVSPNKRKLIASAYGEWDILVLEATGTILNKITYQDQWKLIKWLDNEHLLIQLREPGNSFIVYDPIMDKSISSFAIDAPGAYYIASPPGQNITFTMVDPTATLAIYFDREKGGRAVLWNIQTRKILAWLHVYVPATSSEEDYSVSQLPSLADKNWSSNGSQFVLAAPANYTDTLSSPLESEELFSISRTGVIQQLTFFTQVFDYAHIEQLTWSPDSLQLAFLLQTAPSYVDKGEEQYRLIIYDTQNYILKDFCLSFYFEPWIDIIWSPSGKQLIVQAKNEKTHVRTAYFLDLVEGTIAKFRYDPIIEGWLFGEP